MPKPSKHSTKSNTPSSSRGKPTAGALRRMVNGPDARLLRLGEKLAALIHNETELHKKTKPFRAAWEAAMARKEKQLPELLPGHAHKIVAATAIGKRHAKAWQKFNAAADATCSIIRQIFKLQPATVRGLAVWAIAAAKDEAAGDGLNAVTARLVLRTCKLGKVPMPAVLRPALRKSASAKI